MQAENAPERPPAPLRERRHSDDDLGVRSERAHGRVDLPDEDLHRRKT
jgi:hypothetical protein